MDAWYIILTASLVAASCALLGCFLVLKKMAMTGDAISHAVLPGIVVAYLVSGERSSWVMLVGALVTGLFSTFLIEFFHRKARVQADAAIGVTFTWLFAMGVILISLLAGQVDLDQDCVLYGEIAYVPLDLWYQADGSHWGPWAAWVAGAILLGVIGFVLLGYKELKLTTFDPGLAAALGISVSLWHYLLMGAVSVVTVASFESVGAILVVALLVGPAATAWLLTDSLPRMLGYSVGIGIIASVLGYYLAFWTGGSIAGAMAVVIGLLFAGAFAWERGKRYRSLTYSDTWQKEVL